MNVGDEFVEYLESVNLIKYNKFELEEISGGYYVKDSFNNEFILSSDISDGEVNFTTFFSGQHNNTNWSVVEKIINEGVPSDNIIAIPGAINKTNAWQDTKNVMAVVGNFAKESDVEISSVNAYQFSGSYTVAMERMDSFIGQNPSVKDSLLMFCDPFESITSDVEGAIKDSVSDNIISNYHYEFENLKDTQFIFLGNDIKRADDGLNVAELARDYALMGHNVCIVEDLSNEFGQHNIYNSNALDNNLPLYIFGITDKVNDVNYNVSSMKGDSEPTESSIEELRSGKNTNDNLVADSLSVGEVSGEIGNKYQYLTTLDMDSSYVSSDLSYVEQFGSNVFLSFKSDSLFSTNLSTDNRNDPFLSSINASLNYYYDAVGQSLNSLALETKAVVSAGQSVANMDRYLSNLANTQFDANTGAGTVTVTNCSDVSTSEMGINTMMHDYGTQIVDCSINGNVLRTLLNSNALSSLSNDGINKNSTAVVLDDFIVNNTTLEGLQWDMIRQKLCKYSDLFQLRTTTATALSDAIKEAIGLLIDYLGEYDYLDTSELEEIKLSKLRCEENINTLENEMNSMITVTKVIDGVETSEMDYKHNESTREKLLSEINYMKYNVIPEIDKLIEKLEGLGDKYLEAMSIINTAFLDVKKFDDEVKSIVPSNIVSSNEVTAHV